MVEHGLSVPVLEAIRYASDIASRAEAVRVLAPGEDHEPLVILQVPYASFIQPLVAHVASMERQHPGRTYTNVTADAIPRRWLDNLLFNKGLIEWRQALTEQRSRMFTLVRYY